MRRTGFALLCFALLLLPFSADMGPKPTLDAVVKNAPQGCYADLFVRDDEKFVWYDSGSYAAGFDESRVQREVSITKQNSGTIKKHNRDISRRKMKAATLV